MRFKLPYGLKDGQLVHISLVPKGLNCNCVCPGCGHALIARKGEKTIHHFAHAQHGECAKGLETALHLSAKEILEKHNKMKLPKVEVEFNSYRPNWLVSEESSIEFDEVKLEYRMDSIIPDVLVTVKGRPLMIEITVTHKTEKPKIEKIKQLGISCLEIDLSKIKGDLTILELEHIIIEETTSKQWLYNQKADAYKKKALTFAEHRKTYSSGYIDNCPIRRKTSASVFRDCLICEYCLQLDDGEEYSPLESVLCTGATKVKDFEDIIVRKPTSK